MGYNSHINYSQQRYGRSSVRLQRFGQVRATTDIWDNDLLLLYLGAGLAAALLAAGTVIFSTGSSSVHRIIGIFADDADFGLKGIERENLLSRMSIEERRLFNSHVHYIAEKIEKARPSLSNPTALSEIIVVESMAADLDPLLVAAIIKRESTFNPHAISYKGARGLMQLLPGTAEYISDRMDLEWKGRASLKDHRYNVQLGIAYIKYLQNKFKGNTESVLIAYNWGPGNLTEAFSKRGSIPNVSRQYAKNIINDHRSWSKDFSARRSELQFRSIELS